MEIERKFMVDVENIGFDISAFPKKRFVQAYISMDPTIRIRQEGGDYVLAVKSRGDNSQIVREEFELPLSKSQFERLWHKTEANAVVKDRYFIPVDEKLTAELDVYFDELSGLATVEVEFESLEQAKNFVPPIWFLEDVTTDMRYKNTNLAAWGIPK